MIEQRVSIEAVASRVMKIAFGVFFLVSLVVAKQALDSAVVAFTAYKQAIGCEK